MNNLIPVEGKPNLYRDLNSGAIVNNDNLAYKQHLQHVKNLENQKTRMEILENKVSQINDDLGEIKSLLKNLIKNS